MNVVSLQSEGSIPAGQSPVNYVTARLRDTPNLASATGRAGGNPAGRLWSGTRDWIHNAALHSVAGHFNSYIF